MAGKKGGKKVKKDPNAPKKPKTVYFLFCDDFREKVSKELGVKNAAEVSKELGKRWKEIDAESKKKYEEIYNKAKVAYDKEFEEYKRNKPESASEESSSEDDSDDGKKKKKKPAKAKKDPNAPKRPPSGYLKFCSDNRAALKEKEPKLSMTDMTKKLSVMWKEIDPKEKEKYNSDAAEEKKKFDKEMEAYNKKNKPAASTKNAPASKRRKVESEEEDSSEEDGSEEDDDSDEDE